MRPGAMRVPGLQALAWRARLFTHMMRLEWQTFPGALHASMWLRGFLSNRRYAYPGIDDPGNLFISDVMVEARLSRLNDPAGKRLLEDKSIFADELTARGLGAAAPEVFGTIVQGSFRPRSAFATERLRAQDSVVVKPVGGAGGRGIRMFPGAEVESAHGGGDPELLVQERLSQHPELAVVYPAALNTARVLAIRLPDSGPTVVAAVHRWGTAASGHVDNVSAGGLCSAIDLDSGRLGPAVGRPHRRRRVEWASHPDTGVPIDGRQVPCWPEARDLVLSLMAAFPEVDHVGWDLCIAPTGPVVVEGNANVPNLNVFQFHGSFLHDPRVRAYYVAHGLLNGRRAR